MTTITNILIITLQDLSVLKKEQNLLLPIDQLSTLTLSPLSKSLNLLFKLELTLTSKKFVMTSCYKKTQNYKLG